MINYKREPTSHELKKHWQQAFIASRIYDLTDYTMDELLELKKAEEDAVAFFWELGDRAQSDKDAQLLASINAELKRREQP